MKIFQSNGFNKILYYFVLLNTEIFSYEWLSHIPMQGCLIRYCNEVEVKEFCALKFQNYKIGHLLCRSRNPDFLLDILQRQGTNQAMPWLADLVESSEGSFNVLPVQCLCEFLLNSPITNRDEFDEAVSSDNDAMNTKKLKQKQLLIHLQDLLQNPKSDFRACTETLEVCCFKSCISLADVTNRVP